MRRRDSLLSAAFAITLGMAMTLCLKGYQFGQSNHTVYLIDALRKANPELLQQDWFATSTLQYHAAFGWITQFLVRWSLLETGFLICYLALAFFLHLAWYRIVLRLGGNQMTYLLSALFFHISAAGYGLGMYHFLQDGSFLPSNIANVAMLWGIYFWISRKPGFSGAMFGLAGLFHLNHAIVAVGLWCSLAVLQIKNSREWLKSASFLVGSFFAIGLSLINIALALSVTADRSGGLPLNEFVDLYVRLRHPHHYDPSSWPMVLWICFVMTIPLAVWGFYRSRKQPADENVHFARVQAGRIYLLLCGVVLLALAFAGWFFVSEKLIQMSLYRFSIYILLLSCIGAAWLVHDSRLLKRIDARVLIRAMPIIFIVAIGIVFMLRDRDPIARIIWPYRAPILLFIFLTAVLAIYELLDRRGWNNDFFHAAGILALSAILFCSWGRWLGINVAIEDDAGYIEMCEWARNNTPVDAIFLVPPQEQSFRLHAQRAIVVNFKAVPQLSREMIEWRNRLSRVLDLTDLRSSPRPFNKTLDAMGKRYHDLPASHLAEVADEYEASYIVASRPLEPHPRLKLEHGNDSWFLYHLRR